MQAQKFGVTSLTIAKAIFGHWVALYMRCVRFTHHFKQETWRDSIGKYTSFITEVQKGQFERIPSRYSEDLQKFIGMCLQLQPTKRPTCSQLLGEPKVIGSDLGDKLGDNLNLLETIKLPKNLINLKSMLPKSKYSRSTEDEVEQRIPSRKSEGASRSKDYLTGIIGSTLKKNVSERNMLPELKPVTVAHRDSQSNERNIMNEYYNRSDGKNLELLKLMKER